MARFKLADAEKYGGQGGGGFFSLKKAGDSACVRFLYDNYDDVEGYAVHDLMLNGKKRYVDCLRSHDDALDVCPFCKRGSRVQVRIFIPVYNVDEDRIMVWERGKAFFGRLKTLFAEHASEKPLVSTVFRITKNLDRFGTVQFDIEKEYSGMVEMEDFPEEPSPVYGHLVLQMSEEEMEQYLDTANCA